MSLVELCQKKKKSRSKSCMSAKQPCMYPQFAGYIHAVAGRAGVQHNAVCCSVLQCVAVCMYPQKRHKTANCIHAVGMHPQKSLRCLQQEFYGAYSLNCQATHHCGLHIVRQISEIYILARSASQYHCKCAIHSLECGMLQCVAVCCCVLQSVAVCCSDIYWLSLQVRYPFAGVQHVAVCCSVLQCVAVCSRVLQWYILARSASKYHYKCAIHALECSMLQCVAVCCSVLQSVAVCCSV